MSDFIKETTPASEPASVPVKTTRREFLQEAASKAVGLFGLGLATKLGIGVARDGANFAREKLKGEPSIYDILRERINEASSEEAQRRLYLEKVTNLERSQAILDRFVKRYESVRDSSGQPMLLSLYRKKFANLDIDVENEIFFLKEAKVMQQTNDLVRRLGVEPWDRLDQIKKDFEVDSQNTFPMSYPILAETESRRGSAVKIVSVVGTPKSPAIFEEDKRQILQILEPLPKVQNQEVRIKAPNRYGYTTPPNLLGGSDGAWSIDANGESYIEANLDSGFTERAKYVLIHEFAHSLDVVQNWSLQRYLSPEEIVDLMILREQIMQDKVFGRNYPSIERLFSPDTKFTWGSNPEDIAEMDEKLIPLLSNSYPDDIWVRGRDTESTFISPDYDTRVAYAVRVLGLSDFRKLPFMADSMRTDTNRQITWREFISESRQQMERIGELDGKWKAVFSLILERTEALSNSRFANHKNGEISTIPQYWWNKVYSELTNVVLSEQFCLNNRQIIDLFDIKAAAEFTDRTRFFIVIADTEKFPEAITYMLLGDHLGKGKRHENPFNGYLLFLSKLKYVLYARKSTDDPQRQVRSI